MARARWDGNGNTTVGIISGLNAESAPTEIQCERYKTSLDKLCGGANKLCNFPKLKDLTK